MINIDEQIKIISKGVDEIIGLDELKEKLAKNKPLTVKLGLDPSAPDIHLGHTVVLRKLRQLQDLGHNNCNNNRRFYWKDRRSYWKI